MKLVWCTLTALLMLCAATVSAQAVAGSYQEYNFDFVGGGARAAGMGKAYLALSDDIYAASWNPAGLTIHEKPVFGMSYSSLIPRGSGEGQVLALTPNPLAIDHSTSLGSVSSLAFAAPLRVKGQLVVASISYTRNFDAFQEWGLTHSAMDTLRVLEGFSFVLDSTLRNYDYLQQVEGGLYTLNLAFGTRLYKTVTFGGALNIYAGNSVTTGNIDIISEDYPFGGGQRGVQWVDIRQVDTSKFSGVNFTLGLKYAGEKMNAALVVRTPFTLKANREVEGVTITRERGMTGQFVVRSAATDTVYLIDQQTKYEVPLRIGGGVAFNPSENVTLAADAEYQGWHGSKVLFRDSLTIDPGGNNEEFFSEFDPDWNNVFTFRLGGEYRKQMDFGLMPFRAGFGFVPVPGPSTDENDDVSTAVQYNLSLGTGIHWSQIHLDVAYTYSALNRDLKSVGIFEKGQIYPTTIELRNRNHHLQVAFTGYF